MDLLKTAVRGTVFVFILVATAVTFAGLDPSSKAEVEAITTEDENTQSSVSKVANGKANARELDVISVELSSSR